METIYSLIVPVKFTVTQCIEGRKSPIVVHTLASNGCFTHKSETNLNRNVSKHACSRVGSQQRYYFSEMKKRLPAKLPFRKDITTVIDDPQNKQLPKTSSHFHPKP